MLVTALRYFDIQDLYAIQTMGLNEFQLRLEAYQLRNLDQRQLIAELAFKRQVVQATKGNKGKPVFDSFEKFFGKEFADTEERIKHTFNPSVARAEQSKRDVMIERQKRLVGHQQAKFAGKEG